jgi:hypothetical protein
VLTRNHRQEALSKAYVHAIAARCGLSSSFPEYDYGIDVTLRMIQRREKHFSDQGAVLDIQLKCTTGASVSNTHVTYDLEVKAYIDLCMPGVYCPRILVVMVLPRDESLWLDQTEESLTLRSCAYWISLLGRKPTRAKKTIRIAIPRSQVFSVTALRAILDDLQRRRKP